MRPPPEINIETRKPCSLCVVEETTAPHVMLSPDVVVEVTSVGAVEAVEAVDRVR